VEYMLIVEQLADLPMKTAIAKGQVVRVIRRMSKRGEITGVDLLGADFKELSPEEKRFLRVEGGLKISDLRDGLLSAQGVRKNFIITGIEKRPVKSVEDLTKLLENKKGGVVVEGIYPNRMRAYYLVVIK